MSQPNPPYDPYGQQPGYGGQQQPPPPSDPYGPPQQPYGQPAYGPPQQPQYDQYGLPAGQQSPWEQQQPQHGQPEYGQPQFGQPQQTYGQPVTPPKSRKGLWIGLSAGAVALVLLCCGGAFAFYKWAEDKADEALEPVTRISGNPTPRTSGPPKQPTITLTLPGKVGSRARITDAQHAQFVKDTEAAMKKDAKVSDTVVGYYGTPDPKKDKLYLAGATTTTPMGKAGFEATFKAMSKEAGLSDMTGVTDVNPGPLGGYAKCGLLKIEGMPVAACAWADEGSFVTVMWYNRQVTSQIKAELVTIRGQVEQKS